MRLIGLTGGIAAGKSTVAARFVHAGAEHIDADAVAREVTRPGTEAHRGIVEHFGNEVLDEDGELDRPALGAIVFGDAQQRQALNRITHPPIRAAIDDRIAALADRGGCVVLDHPLLVETDADRRCDAVVVVAATEQTQVDRLVSDRGLTAAQARERIASQAPLEDKLARATHVIWNDGTRDELHARADAVVAELCGSTAPAVGDPA